MTSDWISIEDRLPEKGVDVLCFESCGDASEIHVSSYTGKYRKTAPKTKSWPVFADPTGYYDPGGIIYVTHWMPLPDPPDKKGR